MFAVFEQESFWLSVALVILCIVSYFPLKRIICRRIDHYVNKVNREAREAFEARRKSVCALEDMNKKYTETIEKCNLVTEATNKEAREIVEDAKKSVLDMLEHSKEVIASYNEKRERRLLEKFKQEVVLAVLSSIENDFNGDSQGVLEENIKSLRRFWH